MFYISIQTVQAILRRVRPAPRRQGKGDGQEAQGREVTREKEEGEGGKLLASDDAEMSIVVRARESPVGGVAAEIE